MVKLYRMLCMIFSDKFKLANAINAGYPAAMPNSDRAIANGNPFYLILVDFFGDDVSGNRTKSWNKHWNTYMTNQNLPRRLLQQEFHTHFISTSPSASVTEQFQAFKTTLKYVFLLCCSIHLSQRYFRSTHKEPVVVFDVEANEEVCFKLSTNSGPSDNPMQSEISGHIGGKGNHFCRKCKVGGNKLHKESDDGYHSLFEVILVQYRSRSWLTIIQPGIPRTAAGTLAELKKQVNVSCHGVAKAVSDSQTDTGVKDAYTQFWINQLIERARETKSKEPLRLMESIADELREWVLANEDKIYNPFLSHLGKASLSYNSPWPSFLG
jgi:hypothetical protein